MAKARTLVISSSSNTDAASYVTASGSPNSARFQVLVVSNGRSSASATTPTVTGGGVTWNQVDTQLTGGTDTGRVTVFYGSGTPSAGALTIDFGGTTQQGCGWTWNEFTEVGAVGIKAKASGSDATPIATLGSLTAASAVFGAAVTNTGASTYTVGSGFTGIGGTNPDFCRNNIEWQDALDTSVDMTLSGAQQWGIIAVELLSGSVGSGSPDDSVATRGLSRGLGRGLVSAA